MKSNMGFLKDGRDEIDDDEIHVSDDDDGEEVSSEESSDTDSSDADFVENSSDDSEDSPSAILKSKEIQRNHPPTLSIEDTIADICFHPSNDLFATAGLTGDVLIYKYSNEANELVSTLELHEKACRDIEFSEDGTMLYSTGKDKTIMISDVETEKLIHIFDNAHEHPVYCIALVDDNLFATGDDEGTVKLWDRRQKSNTPIFALKEMDDFVSSMVTNDEKKFLVCASGDGTLTTLNIRGKKLHVRTEDYPEEFTCLGLFKHGRKILVGGSKGNLYLYNWGEFGLHSDEIPSLTKKSINCMIPITENIVITGGEDKVLRATSLFPNRQLGIVGQHELSVECLDICNDGTIIASYSYDNCIKFWNVSYFETLNVTKPLKGGKQKQLKHNLPSSKSENASDFFADL
ncbi:hypothetical protein QAD02_012208 [Eretmocerus hayati]|uniref:Uncharacterized protein n=1 Tax=Eretmocerus hayati TaxID=131215 RepID=A0ACC2P0R0_9HYME|nr:hypothetical protein QAD02_012208 [Eretmocerus hayati]